MKLKLHKSLKSQQFVKDQIQKTIMEVKEIHDVQNYKLNPQLLQDLYVFIQNQIEDSRFSKKKINVIEVLKVVISEVFDLNEQEQSLVETMIEHLVDNKLVKKRGFFFMFPKRLFKTVKKGTKIILETLLLSAIEKGKEELITYSLLKIGLRPVIIMVILTFL